jgi:hypothetical protein
VLVLAGAPRLDELKETVQGRERLSVLLLMMTKFASLCGMPPAWSVASDSSAEDLCSGAYIGKFVVAGQPARSLLAFTDDSTEESWSAPPGEAEVLRLLAQGLANKQIMQPWNQRKHGEVHASGIRQAAAASRTDTVRWHRHCLVMRKGRPQKELRLVCC